MSIQILGIRHHGPGSSFHVQRALEAIQPDIVLVEGPPEGEQMLEWVGHADLTPPVAMLAYVPSNPQQAVFYPFAEYSPEWNAIKYGREKHIPVRFIDMPLVHKFAEVEEVIKPNEPDETEVEFENIKQNPIAYLAEIAGYDDAEEWWERQFEMVKQPEEVFEAIAEAMCALRSELPISISVDEQQREAFMRRSIRLAQREMYTNIVVVCGAWHVPALLEMPAQKHDNELLKNLPKAKVETTWIPWTNERLSNESGYGAGINSPGWYAHCWAKSDDSGVEWMTHSARVLRNHKFDISSAHIIEGVRLANALAQIRGFSKPGLREFNESIQTVMCMGDNIQMQLVHKDLIVGKAMGSIPEGTPKVPLVADFEKQIKSYRLKLSDDPKVVKIDLREDFDLQKSILLHRLNTLDIPWGDIQVVSGKGTFKEEWLISWTPEMHLALIERAPWGNTIESACNQYVIHEANTCNRLSQISSLVQKALPAELHEGISRLMKKLDELAATSHDSAELIDTLIPLAQISRYGNVRNTDLETIGLILTKVFYRMIVGLPISCIGIDEDQAQQMLEKVTGVQQTVLMLDSEEYKNAWLETVLKMSENEQVAPLIQGLCHKILFDTKYVEYEITSRSFSRSLSVQQDPNFSVYWLEGFLKDAGSLLILDDDIWNIIYSWVASLSEEVFHELVPLLRRTFSAFTSVERIKIAEKVKQGRMAAVPVLVNQNLNMERANRVVPIIEKLLQL